MIVTEDLVYIGMRVVRGDDWQWGDQDGNGEGTVITDDGNGWWEVQWDFDGSSNMYRVGNQGKYDLRTA